MRILSRETYRRVPWNNGGGVTDDILVDGDPPQRRLSLARIDRDGPFSDFTGYDRTFVLAGAAGVTLRAQAGRAVVLDRIGALYAFRGEVPMRCALLDGEALAFNVMTRRDAATAEVRVHLLETGAAAVLSSAVAYAFVLSGEVRCTAGDLRVHDTLALDDGTPQLWASTASAIVTVAFSTVPQ